MYEYSFDTQAKTDLFENLQASSGGAISPAGGRLAYESGEEVSVRAYALGAPMGVDRLVSEGGGRQPRWSRDGSNLFYLSGSMMMVAEIDTEHGQIAEIAFAGIMGIGSDGRWCMAPS